MDWKIVLVIFWFIVAIFMYNRYSKVIDALKKDNPDTDPKIYDYSAILVFIFWPFFAPSIIVKTIKKIKEKRKNGR